jgi:hypothetical protein
MNLSGGAPNLVDRHTPIRSYSQMGKNPRSSFTELNLIDVSVAINAVKIISSRVEPRSVGLHGTVLTSLKILQTEKIAIRGQEGAERYGTSVFATQMKE